MSTETNILQGRFTSDGVAGSIIVLRSDIDWMYVYNFTQIAAAVPADVGLTYYWQRGLAAGTGFVWTGTGGTNTTAVTALANPNGFTLVDTSGTPIGGSIATTAASNVVQPVINTGDTTGLTTGSVVRLASIATTNNICGFDFEIDTVNANVSFRMRYALAAAPGAVGGAGTYRRVLYDPIYYPRYRYIVSITRAASAVITTSVQHDYAVGQKVRFSVTSPYGMTQMDGLAGTITAATVSTITVDIDSTAFTAFTWPQPANVPFTYATVVPFGIDTAEALLNNVSTFSDATENFAEIGMQLGGGANTPGGADTNVMYWRAGTAFSVDNL